MKKQKFILQSKTVQSAIVTLAIAVLPWIQDGIDRKFTKDHYIQIASVLLTTVGTIASRYVAQGELYTPHGLPGRDYVSAANQIPETDDR